MRLQILLLLGAAWADVLPNGCPRDFSVHHLLRHEDCTKFYSCSNGVPIEMSCGPGTGFDFDLQICNWLHLVNCVPTTDKPTTTHQTTTTDELTTDELPTISPPTTPQECQDVTWSANMDCDVIKNCADYVKLKFNCPISMDKDSYNIFMEIKYEYPGRTKENTKMYAVPKQWK
ncbi:unnamed protein product [Pieris macdunnoughi]|uniref:Chitin-binding type-2 domain-containing protein n=1 Tax=Pieris macdunnoughi TaxID=345717 RepID=A0A821KYB7_9NEOP|nr:unnamed protein product [Pieris macdunnoughi]